MDAHELRLSQFLRGVLAISAIATVAILASCSPTTRSGPVLAASDCSTLLDAAVQYERFGAGDIDSVMQTLSDNCSDAYEVAVDYLASSTDSAFGLRNCEDLLGYDVRPEAVKLLEEDGTCTFATAVGPVEPPEPAWPNGGLGWDEARAHAGTVQRVCGPLVSVRETDDGTFVNVGLDYPSPGRFTFVFWDVYLDPIDAAATVCGSGEVYLYDGVPQIEMWEPGALEVWR